jgi:PPOX class probable F420-dependent enzyme
MKKVTDHLVADVAIDAVGPEGDGNFLHHVTSAKLELQAAHRGGRRRVHALKALAKRRRHRARQHRVLGCRGPIDSLRPITAAQRAVPRRGTGPPRDDRLAGVDLDLSPVRRIAAQEHGLASVTVVRADGTPHSSLVNAGVLEHPRTGRPVAAYVTYGRVKLRNLAARPATSVLWRHGWRWAAVDGTSELIGPGDTGPEELRLLLRAVFTAAGGTHDDWDTYDRVMREQGRVAVLVEATRVYGNA